MASLKDVRRRTSLQYQDKANQLTAINFKAALIPSMTRISALKSCMPVVVPYTKEEAEA